MKDSARRLWPYIRRYKRGFLLGFAALVLKDLAAAGQPLLIKTAIDSLTQRVFAQPVVEAVRRAGGAFGESRALFQYWMRVILIGISRDIEYDLRNDLFRHLAGLSSDFYSRTRTGDIMARSTNDLERGAHDARPGRHVLGRNHADLRAGHGDHAGGRLAARRCWQFFPRR